MTRSFVHPIDFLLYGFIALIALGGSLLALSLHTNWEVGEVVTLILTDVTTLLICTIVLVKKYYSKPKWITAQKVGVWENIPWFDPVGKMRLNKAIDLFVSIVSVEKQIPKEDILSILSKLNLEWTTSKISLVGIGWAVKDKYGVQQGNNIMVYWTGTLEGSALVHEMIHFIRTQYCRLPTDYKHTDDTWWYLEAKINGYIRNTVCIGEC